jgi:hypothetical protein
MNEIYTGNSNTALPPIQIQPPSMGSVLDMLNVINGILFVQIRYGSSHHNSLYLLVRVSVSIYATETEPMQALRSHGCCMYAYIIVIVIFIIIIEI